MAKVKINVTIDEDLLCRVDRYCDDNFMSRSGLISISVNQFLNTNEALKAIKVMSSSMRKIADKGEVDPETLRDLEDFERLAKRMFESN